MYETDMSKHSWRHQFPNRLPAVQVVVMWYDGPQIYLGNGYFVYLRDEKFRPDNDDDEPLTNEEKYQEWWVGPVPRDFGLLDLAKYSAGDLIQKYCTMICRRYNDDRHVWRYTMETDFKKKGAYMPADCVYLSDEFAPGKQIAEIARVDPIELLPGRKLSTVERRRLMDGRIGVQTFIGKYQTKAQLIEAGDRIGDGVLALQSLDDLGSEEANKAVMKRMDGLVQKLEKAKKLLKDEDYKKEEA